MGPKLLGGAASVLATAFILALPSTFKGEPANEVEPIRLGPPPVAKLAQAVQVVAPESPFSRPATVIPPATPSVASSGGGEGGRAAAGTPVASAQGPGNDVRPSANENASQGGTGASNGNSTAEGEDAEHDDVDGNTGVGEQDDAVRDDEANEVGEDDDEEDDD